MTGMCAPRMDLDYASNLGVARGAWVEFKACRCCTRHGLIFRCKSAAKRPAGAHGRWAAAMALSFAQPYYL